MLGETFLRAFLYGFYYLPTFFPAGTNNYSNKETVSFAALETPVDPIIVAAEGNHTSTIIFLHGLGDTGDGWADEIAQIKPSHSKLICPTAPMKSISINGGVQMPAWYNIKTLTVRGHEDEQGIQETTEYIQNLIAKEIRSGIPAERILLAGFSQGAAMALYTGLTGRYLLGGVVAMSGYLPLSDSINWDRTQRPPILQCHGDMDPIVNYGIALATMRKLQEQQFPRYIFKLYQDLDHSASMEEMDDIRLFFEYILSN